MIETKRFRLRGSALTGRSAVVILCAAICGCMAPPVERNVKFHSVVAPAGGSKAEEVWSLTQPAWAVADAQYLIVGNVLYLRWMAYERHGSDADPDSQMWLIDYLPWDYSRIEELRKGHPELERFWPDPKARGGGVLWALPGDYPDTPPIIPKPRPSKRKPTTAP
jgi:hypothetical protein